MNRMQQDIVALAKLRVPPAHIAQRLKLNVDKVYSAIRRARTEGENIPFFRTRNNPTPEQAPRLPQIVVPIRLHSLLVAEAERRGKSPSALAQTLLEAALLDGWARGGRPKTTSNPRGE